MCKRILLVTLASFLFVGIAVLAMADPTTPQQAEEVVRGWPKNEWGVDFTGTGGGSVEELHDSTTCNTYIPDYPPGELVEGCPIWLPQASEGATVTKVKVHYRIEHTYVGDLRVWLYTFIPGTSGRLRRTYTLHEDDGVPGTLLHETIDNIHRFDGFDPNYAEWGLLVEDRMNGDWGYIKELELWVECGVVDPDPPENLTASPKDTDAPAITVSWDPPSSGPTPGGYAIYINTVDDFNTADYGGVWASSPAQYDVPPDLECGVKYYFWVKSKCYDPVRLSPPSNSDWARIPCAPPQPPENLTASKDTYDDKIVVCWDPPSSGCTPGGYAVYRNTVDNFITAEYLGVTAETCWEDDDVPSCGVQYWYWTKSKCYNPARLSDDPSNSDWGSMTCPPPHITSINRIGDDVTIHWNGEGGISYVVEYSESAEFATHSDVNVGEVTEWTDIGGASGSQRYYRVREESGELYSNIVGLYTVDLVMNRNLVSIPFVPFNASLDNVIGDQLTGHPVSQWASDQILAWDPVGQTYMLAWYRTGQGWRAWDSMDNPPAFDFGPDESYWIIINNAPKTLTLLGEVSETDGEIQLFLKRNFVAPSFPKAVSLDDSGLIGSGFTGHPVSEWASDGIDFWYAAAQTYVGVWYKTGQGWRQRGSDLPPVPPYDEFAPGKGSWLTVNNTPFDWIVPKPY